MRTFGIRFFSVIVLLAVLSGCANIVPPTGGAKDVTAPKLLSITPKDSLLNTKVTEIEMRFDEFITVNDASKEIKISPLLPFPIDAIVNGKKLTLTIPDTLLKDSTTYRISFGSAIKDLNENNLFKDFSYMFSTGDYFDSLKIYGKVYDAATGIPAADIYVVLYDASSNDSAVVRKKPVYFTKTQAGGNFLLRGLPKRAYKIYALKDDDDNLIYGGEDEMIGFIDSIVYPLDTVKVSEPLVLRIFKEVLPVDSLAVEDEESKKGGKPRLSRKRNEKEGDELSYTVNVDTNDIEKRVHDINKPLKITFNNPLDTYNIERVFVSYDSMGVEVEGVFTLNRDTTMERLLLNTDWKENTVYTIRLLKDFATDTSARTALPSKYIFRTKGDDDYGVLNIHIATKYYGSKYLLQVLSEKDTIYKQPITDSSVTLRRLVPAKYTMAIVVDENENGKWDTGDLFAKLQPEMVIPFTDAIELKAGWENVLDFKEPVTEDINPKSKPRLGAAPPIKGDSTGNK